MAITSSKISEMMYDILDAVPPNAVVEPLANATYTNSDPSPVDESSDTYTDHSKGWVYKVGNEVYIKGYGEGTIVKINKGFHTCEITVAKDNGNYCQYPAKEVAPLESVITDHYRSLSYEGPNSDYLTAEFVFTPYNKDFNFYILFSPGNVVYHPDFGEGLVMDASVSQNVEDVTFVSGITEKIAASIRADIKVRFNKKPIPSPSKMPHLIMQPVAFTETGEMARKVKRQPLKTVPEKNKKQETTHKLPDSKDRAFSFDE